MFFGRDAWSEHQARLQAQRKTRPTKQARERDQRAAAHASTVAEFLSVTAYRWAIHRASAAAGAPHWSPHRLRHAAGTRIAEEAGIEPVRAALEHTNLTTSRRYAHGADVEIAKGIASRLG